MQDLHKVLLVDDDELIRRALRRLLSSHGFSVESYESAEALLCRSSLDDASCVILDLGLPGMDGLGVQQTLASRGEDCSVIFVTGQGDIPATVKAMRAGAIDFLTKPVEANALLASVNTAIAHANRAQKQREEAERRKDKLKSLTPREAQVMEQVVAGRLNKQIAADLGTVEKTIKVHRSRVMMKLGVHTVADLVRLVAFAVMPAAPLAPGPTTAARSNAVKSSDG